MSASGPLKKGTGSELDPAHATEGAPPRGTCPLFHSDASAVATFIADLRRRVEHLRSETPLPDSPFSALRAVERGDDLAGRFQTAAEASGCVVRRTTEDESPAVVRDFLQEQGVRQAIIEAQVDTVLTPERGARLSDTLKSAGIGWTADRDDETLFSVGAAVTGVWGAVAETGTIVCVSGPASARGASLIPPIHVALLAESQLSADLFDLFERLSSAGELPANVNMISGPSKTADIEGVLVTGVHGPGTVCIVLLKGL